MRTKVQNKKPKSISKLIYGVNVVILSLWVCMGNRSQCVMKRGLGRVSKEVLPRANFVIWATVFRHNYHCNNGDNSTHSYCRGRWRSGMQCTKSNQRTVPKTTFAEILIPIQVQQQSFDFRESRELQLIKVKNNWSIFHILRFWAPNPIITIIN